MLKRIIAAAALSLLLVLCGCDKPQTAEEASSAIQSEKTEYTADEIRAYITGEWGRLEKVMHYFYNDGSCVIGGMQGTDKIDDDRNLVLTTMSGSVTVYDWASSFTKTDSPDYWYLDGDIITINGNQFTKISDIIETP